MFKVVLKIKRRLHDRKTEYFKYVTSSTESLKRAEDDFRYVDIVKNRMKVSTLLGVLNDDLGRAKSHNGSWTGFAGCGFTSGSVNFS